MEGHSDAITSARFSPDNAIIVTICANSDFRLWVMDNNFFIRDDAHDLGILDCDFSPNLEPIPNSHLIEVQNYLLVTSGNDGFVKLWTITLPKVSDSKNPKTWKTKTLKNIFRVKMMKSYLNT